MLSASIPFDMFVTTALPISSFVSGPITNYVVQLVAYNRAGQSEPILQQVFTTQETVEEDTHLLMPPLEIKAMVCMCTYDNLSLLMLKKLSFQRSDLARYY